jgi:MoxR-like ATPase
MEQNIDVEALNEKIYRESAFIDTLRTESQKVIVGQHQMFDSLMIGLLTKGHILLEGLPGLAKTLTIKTLAQAINGDFQRIQFTPDLLPADIIGTLIYSPADNDFSVRKGPIFANFILADEVNRAPAKVQSALLEAMQERQVTIGNESFKLEEPFLVLATQNPIEQEGTYELPEAQVDRFMLKVKVDYPEMDEERIIIQRALQKEEPVIKPVVEPQAILQAREVVQEIYLDPKIEQYILDLVFASRFPGRFKLENLEPLILHGASPRASINLALASKAAAFMDRRGYVTPEDVRSILYHVMRHRIGLSYEAEAEQVASEEIIERILNQVEVP